MYVLGKSILFMEKSGKYWIPSPHPDLEIYQQNGIMALRMSRLFNLVYIKRAWHRAIVLHYTTSCWSGTPWDTLWETQCHRSDSGLHHRDLSDLLHGHYLILDKMRGTSNKTFSSCTNQACLVNMSQSLKELLEIKTEKKNPKDFKRCSQNLTCTLLTSSPYDFSIILHGCIYQVSLLWRALSFFMYYSLRLYPQALTMCLIKMHPGHRGNSMQRYKWISRNTFPQIEKDIQSLCHDEWWVRCIIFWSKDSMLTPWGLNECWRWPADHTGWWSIRHQNPGS